MRTSFHLMQTHANSSQTPKAILLLLILKRRSVESQPPFHHHQIWIRYLRALTNHWLNRLYVISCGVFYPEKTVTVAPVYSQHIKWYLTKMASPNHGPNHSLVYHWKRKSF